MASKSIGPWAVTRSSRAQAGGDFFVSRELPSESSSFFEQLRSAIGVLMRFETEEEATEARDEAQAAWDAMNATWADRCALEAQLRCIGKGEPA